jgi:hypothetical protein
MPPPNTIGLSLPTASLVCAMIKIAHVFTFYDQRLMAIGAVSRASLFSLRGGGRDGYGGSRHSGHGEIIAKRVPLCDGMRPSVAF